MGDLSCLQMLATGATALAWVAPAGFAEAEFSMRALVGNGLDTPLPTLLGLSTSPNLSSERY